MRAPLSSLLLAAACLAGVGCASKPPEGTAVASLDQAFANDASNSLHLTSQSSSQPVDNKSDGGSVGDSGAAVATSPSNSMSNSAAVGGGVTRSLRKTSMSASSGGGNGATAPTYRPGSDNEIVARRLKKAAEQERNPSLRAKLWKEYTDYLQGASAK